MWTTQDCSSLEFLYSSSEDYISGGGFSHCLVVCVTRQPTRVLAGVLVCWVFQSLHVASVAFPSSTCRSALGALQGLCPLSLAGRVTAGQSFYLLLLSGCLGLLSRELRTVTATAIQRTLKVKEKQRGLVLEVRLWKQK